MQVFIECTTCTTSYCVQARAETNIAGMYAVLWAGYKKIFPLTLLHMQSIVQTIVDTMKTMGFIQTYVGDLRDDALMQRGHAEHETRAPQNE